MSQKEYIDIKKEFKDFKKELEDSTPLFDDDNMFLPKPITVREAIAGLPEIENGGGALEMEWEFINPSPYDLLMQRKITFDEFYQMKKDKEGK
jgi:DNA (cytosine-5)-methyltransferase 1